MFELEKLKFNLEIISFLKYQISQFCIFGSTQVLQKKAPYVDCCTKEAWTPSMKTVWKMCAMRSFHQRELF